MEEGSDFIEPTVRKAKQGHIKREELLRHWHSGTLSDDPTIRSQAEARLGLQIRIRETNASRARMKEARDKCKETEDEEGLEKARKTLKKHGRQIGHFVQLARNGISSKTESKLRKSWLANSLSLEELLASTALDGVAEFQVPRQLYVQEGEEEGTGEDTEGLWTLLSSNSGCAAGCQDVDQIQINEEKLQAFEEYKESWQRHEHTMRSRYHEAGLAECTIELKLAVQRRDFEFQAFHCHHVNVAYEKLKTATSLGEKVPIGMNHNEEVDVYESTFTHETLWRVSSIALWAMYAEDESWDLAHWSPGGYMRLHTMSDHSTISIDWGHRSFSVDSIKLPRYASIAATACTARCDKTGSIFGLELLFLGNGHVRLIFPAHPILIGDQGCSILPWMDDVVDFAVTCEGPI